MGFTLAILLAVALHALLLAAAHDGVVGAGGAPGDRRGHVVVLASPPPAGEPSLTGTRGAQPAEPVERPPAAEQPTRSVGSQAVVMSSGRDEDYLDAARLSVRPSPIGEIKLPEPQMGSRLGSARAVMTLFIDETGRVVRTRVESSNLPATAQTETLRAFADAPFHPGQSEGRVVRSRLRVEVVIESVPSADGPGSAGPRPASSPDKE